MNRVNDFLAGKDTTLQESDVLEFFKDPDLYSNLMNKGLEDDFFCQIDTTSINNYALEVIRTNNIKALDFIINSAHELQFNINSEIKNRGFVEIALFFNREKMLSLLLRSGLSPSNRVSNASVKWIKDNFEFLNSPMHTHFKDQEWRNEFLKILEILEKEGWPSIKKTCRGLLYKNTKHQVQEIESFLSKDEVDLKTIIRRIKNLDKNSIKIIKDSI
jgi:hypothetical protein